MEAGEGKSVAGGGRSAVVLDKFNMHPSSLEARRSLSSEETVSVVWLLFFVASI